MVLVVAIAILLGVTNLARAGAAALGAQPPDEKDLLLWAAAAALLLTVPVVRGLLRRRG